MCLWTAGNVAVAQAIADARYGAPTTRYAHGVLGDAVEWGALEMRLADGRTVRLVLPETRVFEDIAPRLVDLDSDGAPEVIVVESDNRLGARLAVYGSGGMLAATPFIGRAYRWLAPIGAADLDGDGAVEIAFVDRPHLAKTLRIWRYRAGALAEVASLPGLTNHQIGWDFIAGGIRDCGQGPEMITADGDWRRVMATGFGAGRFASREIGAYAGPDSLRAALDCR
ncbi:FG-GAP repeat domain-containing protein [Mesobacterium hydrothermale]|nr:VCBS repeat-containing protein [Mesobacterium sp. TK19101]